MRDMFRFIYLVPIVIVLGIFFISIGGGSDIDLESSDGSIVIDQTGEDYDLSTSSMPLQYFAHQGPDPGVPALTIQGDPTIDVLLQYPYGPGKPVYTVEVDLPHIQAAVGNPAALEMRGPDTYDTDPNTADIQPGDVGVRELRITPVQPLSLTRTYDDSDDELTIIYAFDHGAANQALLTNSGGTGVEWGSIDLSVTARTGTQLEVASTAAGTSATIPSASQSEAGLMSGADKTIVDILYGGTDGQVLTRVSGAPAWAASTGGGATSPANFTVYMGYTSSNTPTTAAGYRTELESANTVAQQTETLAAFQRATMTAPQTSIDTGSPLFAWPMSEGAPDEWTMGVLGLSLWFEQMTGTIELSGIEYEVWRLTASNFGDTLDFYEGNDVVLTWDLPAPVPSGGAAASRSVHYITTTTYSSADQRIEGSLALADSGDVALGHVLIFASPAYLPDSTSYASIRIDGETSNRGIIGYLGDLVPLNALVPNRVYWGAITATGSIRLFSPEGEIASTPLKAEVTVTASQLRNLNDTRVQLIAAPGANMYIAVSDIWLMSSGLPAPDSDDDDVETGFQNTCNSNRPTTATVSSAARLTFAFADPTVTGLLNDAPDVGTCVQCGPWVFSRVGNLFSGDDYTYGADRAGHGYTMNTALVAGIFVAYPSNILPAISPDTGNCNYFYSDATWDAFVAPWTTGTYRVIIFYEIRQVPI